MMPALTIIDLEVTDEAKRLSSCQEIAASIVDIKNSKGRCTPRDLRDRGHSTEEITRHWHFAHSIASLAIRNTN